MNPLQMSPNRTPTLSDGNLTVSLSSGSSEWTNTGCTMNIGSGKYYWEVQFTTINGTIARIGVADSDDYEFNRNTSGTGLPWMGSGTGKSWSLDVGGNTLHNGSTVNASYTSTIITSDIIGVLLDLDNNTLSYSKNGTNLGVAHSNVTSDFVTPGFGLHGATTNTINVNFGQKPFKFPPPAGYKLLNAANVRPDTVITRPDQYVDVRSGLSAQFTISDLDFKTDLVIAKSTSHDEYWIWADSVRGFIGGLRSNGTNTEGSGLAIANVNSNGYQSDSNWFTNGRTYVTYSFKAGGNKNTFNVDDVGYASAAAAGLTGGTITPTGASVGTKQGFSIIKYTGNSTANATLPHGLSEVPKFVIIKNLSNSYGWAVLHTDVGTTGTTLDGSPEYYMMDLTSTERANFSQDTIWNPTSTTVKIDQSGGANWVNNSNSDYIAYLWHDVPGLQKFGSYAGSSGTTFVNLGFRPELLVIKFYDGTDVGSHAGWKVIDNQRNKFNPSGIAQKLAWDVNETENGGTTISTSEGKVDFLSNGFRILDNHSPFNTSGRSYIYMAWAEAPASNLYGGQSNAR
jgi:hypothetical protein